MRHGKAVVVTSRSELRELGIEPGPNSPLREIGKPRKKRGNPEHDGQAEYFMVRRPRLQEEHPEAAGLFELTYANPNWQGLGTAKMGMYLAAEGKRSGIPDLTHPVSRWQYHGLYIENKIGRTTLSDTQNMWIGRLHRQGYAVVVCRGFSPEQLANSIAMTIKGYTLYDVRWHEHIPTHEKWL